jgi:hypothetical protein
MNKQEAIDTLARYLPPDLREQVLDAFSPDKASEHAIEVERYERPGGYRWRIASYYDGQSIALTEAGCRELLDYLLHHVGEFTEQTPPVFNPKVYLREMKGEL